MKIIFPVILFLFIVNSAFAFCLCESGSDTILQYQADKQPVFLYGEGLENFIYQNLQWPSPQFCGEGTVLASFVIDKSGKVTNIKIERGLCEMCDKEVISVINLMPEWEPGELNSEKVAVKMYIPVKFVITR